MTVKTKNGIVFLVKGTLPQQETNNQKQLDRESTTTMKTNSSLAEIRALEAKTAELRTKFETERNARLTDLHNEVGFETTEDLIKALVALTKPAKKAKKAKVERKARVSLTPESRAALIVDLTSDKFTNDELAAKYGISTATVQNVKKDAGLVKPTAASKDAEPAAPAAAAAAPATVAA